MSPLMARGIVRFSLACFSWQDTEGMKFRFAKYSSNHGLLLFDRRLRISSSRAYSKMILFPTISLELNRTLSI